MIQWYEVWAVEVSLGEEPRELWTTATAKQDELNFVRTLVDTFDGGPDYRDFEIRLYILDHGVTMYKVIS